MIEFFQALHWGAIAQIVVIDILLGGDNAVVIALACRNLQAGQRMRGIIWGTAGAIVLRVVLIAFALALLEVPYLKIIGALLLVWIGVKLMLPEEGHRDIAAAGSVWRAVRTVIVADLVMSLDNVIAIAGAAGNAAEHHQIFYVVFGLLLSVPIIVWGSTLVLRLIDRFPVVITLGAALLGWIAGGMLMTDMVVVDQIGTPSTVVKIAGEVAGAVIVVAIGWFLAGRKNVVKESTHGPV
jgi:YjbE family integral membrane protein